MRSNSNKLLIQKYLNGKCTSEELATIRELLSDPEIKQLFDEVWTEEWKDKFEAASTGDLTGEERLIGWKQKMRFHIAQADAKAIPLFQRSTFWRYAAIWLIFLTSAGLFGIRYIKKSQETVRIAYIEKANPLGVRTQMTLPDSSIVYLGPGSKIRFRETFAVDHRDIELDGEAYFEVVHNAQKPFIVHTGNLQTKDIGTSFKITAFKNRPLTIAVASGKVNIAQLLHKKLNKITDLIPGQNITWEHSRAIKTDIAIADVNEWKNGRLAYNKKSMEQITEDLERWYNVKFIYRDEKLRKIPITITLMTNVSISNILEVLGVSAQFKFKIQGNNITVASI